MGRIDREITAARCDVCGNWIPLPKLQHNSTYDIMVCPICHDTNEAGWAPVREGAVTQRLIEQGLPLPPRNDRGWLPRE